MIDVALRKSDSYALWSGAGAPGDAWQRASTTDDFPKRSSFTRETGVLVLNIVAGEVTAAALSSIETWIRSFTSRRRRTRVSTRFLESWLKEYWTVENNAFGGNSRRTRT